MKRILFTIIILMMVLTNAIAQTEIKPNIPPDKALTKEEQAQVRNYLDGKVFKQLEPAKNDYVDKYNKGTYHLSKTRRPDGSPSHRNYAFCKVVIPDGTVVKSVNFAQKEPDTEAITGLNLTFIECNLVNVKAHPSWTLQNCNNAQIKKILKRTEDALDEKGQKIGTKVVHSHQARDKDGKFVEVEENEETAFDDDAGSYDRIIERFNK